MRQSKIAVICLILSLALAGCGFTPMYGGGGVAQDGAVQARFNTIAIDNIPDRSGQYLRNQLIDRLHDSGTPQSPAYRLSISPVQETSTVLDITKDANATRNELRLSAEMKLIDVQTGGVLFSRTLFGAVGYNILSSQFTTRVSEENARENILNDLARQAEQYILLYFQREKTAPGEKTTPAQQDSFLFDERPVPMFR